MRWYRRFVARKFDGSKRRSDRPEIPPHVYKLVLRFARENRRWGYDRIAGAVSNLGYEISDQSVGNILKRHGLEPVSERQGNGTWREFIHLASRRVVLAGTTPNPPAQLMEQVARNVTGWDGQLEHARYTIHDGDTR